MWYDINWNVFGIQMLPTKWRDSPTIAFVKVLLKQIDLKIYYVWYNWRIENIYKLENTGQVCSLRGSLNDRFDPIERRIYIGDGQDKATTYIYTEAEYQQVYVHKESEAETLFIYTESETADTGLDFLVYVPQTIKLIQEYALKAHIDFYKAGGMRYAIIGF